MIGSRDRVLDILIDEEDRRSELAPRLRKRS